MLSEETKKSLQESFRELPESLQKAVAQINLPAQIQKVAQKNHLRVDEAGTLEDITTFILLGLIHPDELEEKLHQQLSHTLSNEVLSVLLNDINAMILNPVRTSLLALQENTNNPRKSRVRSVEEMKLGGVMHTATEHAEVKNQQSTAHYSGEDPYREPIE